MKNFYIYIYILHCAMSIYTDHALISCCMLNRVCFCVNTVYLFHPCCVNLFYVVYYSCLVVTENIMYTLDQVKE